MDEKQRQQMDELNALSKPLNEWLQKNFDPHTKIIIENNSAEIVQGVMKVPFEVAG